MKAGEVYVLKGPAGDHTILILSRSANNAEVIGIEEPAHIRRGYFHFEDDPARHGFVRADWSAWAEAVGKLSDYLLALPAEALADDRDHGNGPFFKGLYNATEEVDE